MSPRMPNLSEGLTSFQQEFNRLSFLASIATDQTNNQQIINDTSNQSSPISSVSQSQTPTASSTHVVTTISNIAIENKLGQISSLLNIPQQTNARGKSAVKTPRLRSYTPRGSRQRAVKSAVANGKMQVRSPGQIQMVQFASPSQNLQQLQAGQATFPQGISQLFATTNKIPIQQVNGKVITQPHNLLINKIQGGTFVMPTTQASVNQPIIFSNIATTSSGILQQQQAINQAPANGQTILLPANLAGISGKVLIVNQGGQTIAVAQSPAAMQNIQTLQNVQLQPSSKQAESHKVSASSATSTSSLISQNIPTSKKKLQTIKTSNFQTIRPKSFPTLQPKIISKPSILQTVRSVNNKVLMPLGQTKTNTQAGAVSNKSTAQTTTTVSSSCIQSSLLKNPLFNTKQIQSPKQSNTSAIPIPKNNTVTEKIISLSNTASNSDPINIHNTENSCKITMSSLFDRNISQHLQTLQQTDPHLFDKKTLEIINTTNALTKPTFVTTTTPIPSIAGISTTLHNKTVSQTTASNVSVTKQEVQNKSELLKREKLLKHLQQQQQQMNTGTSTTEAIIQNILKEQQQLQKKHLLQKQIQQQQQVQFLQQQLLKQLTTAKVPTTITSQTAIPIQQLIMANSLSQNNIGSTQQTDGPLKLLSSLTNNVNKSVSSESVSQPSITLSATPTGGIQPIFVRLPETQLPTQIIQANQITSTQLLELQKRFYTTKKNEIKKSTANSSAKSTMSTTKSQSVFSVQPTSSNINFLGADNNIITINNVNQSEAKLMSELKKENTGTNEQERYVLTKAVEGMKNYTPAQKAMLLRQLKKASIEPKKDSQNLLSSYLRNKLSTSLGKNETTQGNSIINVTNTRPLSQTLNRELGKRSLEPSQNIEEHPFAKRWKQLLLQDQTRHNTPDTKRRFESMDDVMHRLLPYHVSQEEECPTASQFDNEFESYAKQFMERKRELQSKMDVLFMNDSMSEYCIADAILCNRLLVKEEEEQFNQEKSAILKGRAFVVKNKDKDSLDCVEIKTEELIDDGLQKSAFGDISLNFTDQRQLDRRLKIAHKDISNIKIEDTDSEEETEITDENTNESQNELRTSFADSLSFELDDDVTVDDDVTGDDDIKTENDDSSVYVKYENDVDEISTTSDDFFSLHDNHDYNDETSTATSNLLMEHESNVLNGSYGEDEMAAATTNLLADLRQEDDVFDLNFML